MSYINTMEWYPNKSAKDLQFLSIDSRQEAYLIVSNYSFVRPLIQRLTRFGTILLCEVKHPIVKLLHGRENDYTRLTIISVMSYVSAICFIFLRK